MENKVKYGICNVHYAMQNISSTGAITFGTPKPLPGAINLSLAAQGETSEFYADNYLYHVTVSNSGYAGDLELARITNDFRKDVLGETELATSKVLVENSTLEQRPFALLFETNGNVKATRHALLNCVATRPDIGGQTIEKQKTPTTEKIGITAAPMPDGRVKVRTTENTPADKYNGWFTKVFTDAT